MSARPIVSLLLVATVVFAGCGGGGSSDSSYSSKGDSKSGTGSSAEPEAGTPGAAREKVAAGAFADTPEIERCMTAAGFAKDAPPTGGLAAWRGPDGARAVVGSGTDVTVGIASEIGAADDPADVHGTVVIAGPDAPSAAAATCLQDVSG